MSPVVILDADFLSAMLKIERLNLVRDLFNVETVTVPLAVYQEIAVTTLLPQLLAHPWVTVQALTPAVWRRWPEEGAVQRLGRGEIEAIILALNSVDAFLLINDRKARRVAVELGVRTLNMPAFLLACKHLHLLDRQRMAEVVRDLREKDYYGFQQEVLKVLLI